MLLEGLGINKLSIPPSTLYPLMLDNEHLAVRFLPRRMTVPPHGQYQREAVPHSSQGTEEWAAQPEASPLPLDRGYPLRHWPSSSP